MAIEWLHIDKIYPYPGNANTHPVSQLEKLANSIREFGVTKPVLIDAQNVLITGHGTREAAILAGVDKLPCLRKSDWSERQVKAYRLADNQLARLSKDDFSLLSEELDALINADFDIDLLGFNEQEIEALLKVDPGIMPNASPTILQTAPPVAPPPKSANVKAKIVRDIVCPKCNHKFQG